MIHDRVENIRRVAEVSKLMLDAGLITLVLNILMIAIAYSIAKFFGSGKKQQITILNE